MQTLDIIILVILVCGLITGFKKGFFNQLASLAGLVLGLVAAWLFYPKGAELLAPYLGGNGTICTVVSFVAIWLIAFIIISILVKGVGKAVDAVNLGFLNRLLGGALGVAKYVLLLCLVVWALDSFDQDGRLVSEETKTASKFYAPIKKLNATILPYAQDFIQDNVPEDVLDKVKKASENIPLPAGGKG